MIDMAAHPEGYDLSKEQAVLAVCSTQVRGSKGLGGWDHKVHGSCMGLADT